MLDTLWELGQNISGAGMALAGKALSSVMDLVRDVALKVEEHTGLPVPFGAPVRSWDQSSSAQSYDDGGQDLFHDEVGDAVERAASEPVTANASAAVVNEASWQTPESNSDAPVAKTATKRKPAAKKKASAIAHKAGQAGKAKKGKGTGKAKKRAASQTSQITRLLGILAEDSTGWMSAGELSAATDREGTKILPGNVRKAVRLRGEGLIEMRPREGSRRGAMEYRATKKGLEQVKG